MENDEIISQLEEWKQKYYQALSELEQSEAYDKVLERSLGRLALAARGLDGYLDRQLDALRMALRGKNDHQTIADILEKVEKALGAMEAGDSKTASAGNILAQLLSSFHFTGTHKKTANTLSKQLKSASDTQAAKLLPEVSALLEAMISSGNSAVKPSLRNLFGLLGAQRASTANATPDMAETEQKESTPTHQVLMHLLERLSLPKELSLKATSVRQQLEKGISDAELPQIIAAIADIVSTLGSQVITEKQDYEAYLTSVNDKLNELSSHIHQASNDEVDAFEQRNQIGQQVENEVSGIRHDIQDAQALDDLKHIVNQRLDTLTTHVDRYREADRNRFEASQQQIAALTQRLSAMEQETESLKQTARQARDQALKDTLTGIWNRQALNELLEREYARWQRYQKPLSIIIWDIDYFKRVNDSYGHTAGDRVLRTIATIFQKATRTADFIARYGGEEFVGVFPETRLEDALILANKIRAKVENSKFHYENQPVPITASAGLATFRPNDTIERVFKRADKALYKAKQEGRNRCIPG